MALAHLRGMALYRAKRYGLAADEFRRALQENPQDAHFTCMLAMALSFDKQHAAAMAAADGAVQLAPNYAFAHYTSAVVTMRRPNGVGPRPLRLLVDPLFEKRQKLQLARNAAVEAIRLDPDDADFYYQAAAIEFNLHNRKAALRWAERGLTVQPDHLDCGNLRARILRTRGRHREAKQAVAQVLAVHPESAAALENQAWLLLQENRPAQAAQTFADALRLDPNSAGAQSGLRAAQAREQVESDVWLRTVEASQRRFGVGVAVASSLLMLAVSVGLFVWYVACVVHSRGRMSNAALSGTLIAVAITYIFQRRKFI